MRCCDGLDSPFLLTPAWTHLAADAEREEGREGRVEGSRRLGLSGLGDRKYLPVVAIGVHARHAIHRHSVQITKYMQAGGSQRDPHVRRREARGGETKRGRPRACANCSVLSCPGLSSRASHHVCAAGGSLSLASSLPPPRASPVPCLSGPWGCAVSGKSRLGYFPPCFFLDAGLDRFEFEHQAAGNSPPAVDTTKFTHKGHHPTELAPGN